jgi:ABC-type transporter MlaC component
MLCNPSGKRNLQRSREIKMKKWMMKVLLYAVFSLILLSQAVTADDESAAEEFIKSNLDAVFSVLQKKDLSQQAKNSEVEEIVTPMFDFKLMGKLSPKGEI